MPVRSDEINLKQKIFHFRGNDQMKQINFGWILHTRQVQQCHISLVFGNIALYALTIINNCD